MSCYKISALSGQPAERTTMSTVARGWTFVWQYTPWRSSQRPGRPPSWLLPRTGRMTAGGGRWAWSPRKGSRAWGSFPGHSEASAPWEDIWLWLESFNPPAVILIQSFSFIAVKPFWSPSAVAENARELWYEHFYLPRHLRGYLKFQGLHIIHTAPSGRSFQSPILTLLNTQSASLVPGWSTWELLSIVHSTCWHEPAEQWDAGLGAGWHLGICSSFVWSSEHMFSGNQLVVVGFWGSFTSMYLNHEATADYN